MKRKWYQGSVQPNAWFYPGVVWWGGGGGGRDAVEGSLGTGVPPSPSNPEPVEDEMISAFFSLHCFRDPVFLSSSFCRHATLFQLCGRM